MNPKGFNELKDESKIRMLATQFWLLAKLVFLFLVLGELLDSLFRPLYYFKTFQCWFFGFKILANKLVLLHEKLELLLVLLDVHVRGSWAGEAKELHDLGTWNVEHVFELVYLDQLPFLSLFCLLLDQFLKLVTDLVSFLRSFFVVRRLVRFLTLLFRQGRGWWVKNCIIWFVLASQRSLTPWASRNWTVSPKFISGIHLSGSLFSMSWSTSMRVFLCHLINLEIIKLRLLKVLLVRVIGITKHFHLPDLPQPFPPSRGVYSRLVVKLVGSKLLFTLDHVFIHFILSFFFGWTLRIIFTLILTWAIFIVPRSTGLFTRALIRVNTGGVIFILLRGELRLLLVFVFLVSHSLNI